MRTHLRWAPIILFLALTLTACIRQAGDDPGQALDRAAAEATAIIQRAQATALVQRAQAQATALIAAANASPTAPQATTAPQAAPPGPVSIAPPTALATALPAVASLPMATPTAVELAPTTMVTDTDTVTVASVGLAADGGFLIINFQAPPQVATRWYQGAVSLTDEATGAIYSEIPVMPVVGPLFGRPVEPGQPGYVMLVNAPNRLQVGAKVTVVLGDYRFEHLLVQ
jgi:hypothetical protein